MEWLKFNCTFLLLQAFDVVIGLAKFGMMVSQLPLPNVISI